jgi:hypothetical protein
LLGSMTMDRVWRFLGDRLRGWEMPADLRRLVELSRGAASPARRAVLLT